MIHHSIHGPCDTHLLTRCPTCGTETATHQAGCEMAAQAPGKPGLQPATITRTPYGAYTHGVPAQYGYGAYSRMDTWYGTQHHADDGHRDRFRCTDLHDDSPGYHGPYDGARCGCCWLGHGHTQAYHDRAIAAHNLEETLHAGRR